MEKQSAPNMGHADLKEECNPLVAFLQII